MKLLFRGKKLGDGNESVTLDAAGVRDRTKLMAMHTALYHKHAEAIKAMDALAAQRGAAPGAAALDARRGWLSRDARRRGLARASRCRFPSRDARRGCL